MLEEPCRAIPRVKITPAGFNDNRSSRIAEQPPPAACSWPPPAAPRSASTAAAASPASAAAPTCWKPRPAADHDAGGHRPLHRGDRHRLHVRAEPPSGDEERRPGAQGTGHPHDLQHPRAAHQPGRRAEYPDGRLPSRSGRHPGARPAAPGRRARDRRLRARRHGRGLAGRRDDGRRAEGRRDPRVRHPSRGFRPDDVEQPGAQRRDAGAVEGDARIRARRTSRAPARDIVALNAGAALYAANVADSIADGIGWRARRSPAGGPRPSSPSSSLSRARRPERRERHPEQIVAVKRDEVAAAKKQRGLASLRGDAEALGGRRATSSPRCAGAIAAGDAARHRRDQEGEPEQGRVARGLRPAEIAAGYARHGAAAPVAC